MRYRKKCKDTARTLYWQREETMAKSHKVLMLVENLSVPADPRVWREACTLRQQGLQVCIISPKGETRDRESYVCIEDIHIYRYRLAPIIGSTSDYIKEFSIAMIMTFLLSLKVLFRHGFDVIHAANPPDTFFVIGLFYQLLGKKYIFDQRDLAPEMFHVKFPNRLKIGRASCRERVEIFVSLVSWNTR